MKSNDFVQTAKNHFAVLTQDCDHVRIWILCTRFSLRAKLIKLSKVKMDASFASLQRHFSSGPLFLIVYLEVIPPSLIEMVKS
jgi:hypothetical protein